MPIFILIAKHSPENCPEFNAKARKAMMNYMDERDKLLKKHKVKAIGSWDVPPEHVTIMVFEAPSYEAFQNFGMEPPVAGMSEFITNEVKAAVITTEEHAKMIRQMR
jgi:carbamate kinase